MDVINVILPVTLILAFVGLIVLANVLVPETKEYNSCTLGDDWP